MKKILLLSFLFAKFSATMKVLTFSVFSLLVCISPTYSICCYRTYVTSQTRKEALRARHNAEKFSLRQVAIQRDLLRNKSTNPVLLDPLAMPISQKSCKASRLNETVLPQPNLSISAAPAIRRPQCSRANRNHIALLAVLGLLVQATLADISDCVCLQRDGPENRFTQDQDWNTQCLFEKNQCVYGVNESNAVIQALKQILPNTQMKCQRLQSPSHTSVMYKCAPKDNLSEKKYVARVMHRDTDSCENERAAHLKVLALHTGVTPKIYSSNCSPDFSYIIMDFIPSRSLTLPEINQRSVLHQTAALFRNLSKIPLNNINERDVFAEIRESSNKLMNYNNTLSPVVREVMKKIETIEQKIFAAQLPSVFSHGELHSRNLFCHDGNVMAVDWEFAAAMPQFYDLAYFSVLNCLNTTSDMFLLSHYLGKAPDKNELKIFGLLKLVVRASDAFYFLSGIPLDIVHEFVGDNFDLNHLQTEVKDYTHYQNIFAEDLTIIPSKPTTNSLRYKLETALAGLIMFFKECGSLL